MRTNTDTEERSENTHLRSVQEDAFQFRYNSSDHDLGVRVIEAIAAADDINETKITMPLRDVIDPEALDSLFIEGGRGQVIFQFVGYRVTVNVFEDGTGQIYIE